MHVRDGMSNMVLMVGPGHTLREAAKAMSERRVGAAVVLDPDAAGTGILTEVVADHLTSDVVYAAPEWSLEEAAVAMVRGSFRHLIVYDRGEIVGILSVRDVVRCWTDDGAICEVPESVPTAAQVR
jgi:CBS domain-containing protein